MKLIALKSHDGRYVGAAADGKLTADKTSAEATVFGIEDISNSGVGVRSGSAIALKAPNGKYVCAEGGGGQQLVADRDARQTWETFTLYDVDRQGFRHEGKIGLRCFGGQFVCAEGGGGQAVIANRTNLAEWETFTIESRDPVPGPGTPVMAAHPPLLADGVFEGGGALGVAYVGALRATEGQRVWFQRVVGNSAGAITACMLAAGLTAEEMEYMAAPAGMRPRPASLPIGLEPIAGYTLQDLPRDASELPVSVKRNNVLHHLLRASLVDELLAFVLSSAPDPTPFVDAVMAVVPDTIEFPAFAHRVPAKVISVKNPAFRYGVVDIPEGAVDFEWTVDAYDINVPGGQVNISGQKAIIRNAVAAQIAAMRAAAAGAATTVSLPAARMAFADGVMDRLLNRHRFLRAFYSLMGQFGIFKGEVILEHLRNTLSKKLGGSTIRFRDLPVPLAVIASDMTNKKMVVYSTNGTPDFEVAEAVRRSLSVPMYFQARVENGIDYVDGGMLENFPLWLFLIEGVQNPYMSNGPLDKERPKLLYSVNSTEDVPEGATCPRHAADETDNPLVSMADRMSGNLIERHFAKRISDLISLQMEGSAMGEAMAMAYAKDFNIHRAKIPLAGFDWLDFDMDEPEFLGMCCRGWEAATQMVKAGNLNTALVAMPTENPYK